jgi:DNA invertase Pin-like site-specific DNA recombinase
MTAKFVVYLRVSTVRQGQSGLGLEAQRQAVASFIGSGEVLAEYIEVESGKKDRPAPAHGSIRRCEESEGKASRCKAG